MCRRRIRQRGASLCLLVTPRKAAPADSCDSGPAQLSSKRVALLRVLLLLIWSGAGTLGPGFVDAAFGIAAITIPPPCTEALFDAQSIDVLAADVKVGAGGDGYWTASCASEALSRKGEEAIPPLMPLMESSDSEIASLALNAVCGTGHRGGAALAYILNRIRKFDYAFSRLAYPILACMQDAARPAIPLLVARSLQTIPIVPAQDGDAAIETLGRLGALDPNTIVPHLIKLLELPIHTAAAAKALEQIGEPARYAAPSLRTRLDLAIRDRHDGQEVGTLISAVGRVGSTPESVAYIASLLDGPYGRYAAKGLGEIGTPARAAVPLLLGELGTAHIKPEDRFWYLDALTSIEPESDRVHRAFLREAIGDSGAILYAASSLSEIDPLPADYAPVLARQIEKLDADDGMRVLLGQALQHTHTGTEPGAAAPSHHPPPPVPAPLYLAHAIDSLAKQPHAVTLRDAMSALELNPRDYERKQSSATLAQSDSGGARKVVASVYVSQVTPRPEYPPSMVPGQVQTVRVTLSEGRCLPIDFISEVPKFPLPKHAGLTIEVVARQTTPAYRRFRGHWPNDKFAATESAVYMDEACGGTIEIYKSFASDYWTRKCPFVYDHAFVNNRLIPVLRRQIEPDVDRYNLDAPAVEEWGPDIKLTFAAPTDSTDSAPKNSLRLGVWLERCSGLVRGGWEY
jgi:hypothetical protein